MYAALARQRKRQQNRGASDSAVTNRDTITEEKTKNIRFSATDTSGYRFKRNYRAHEKRSGY